MTVEEKRRVVGKNEGIGDQFPIGMRVLAVDDDPICLKVLETMLLRCQYHVTTTNQAIKALKMLRVNKDKFDLVISDVHMPDMDGFKLLELVGLEMDLPVIMLSANGETKAVMKGITHGACDYLLKPVRIEELRNIWQHVVRRRKFDHKERYKFDKVEDNDKPQVANSEGAHPVTGNETSEQSGKVNRKRKDSNDEDEDCFEETMHEGDDPSNQKKSRVVWSVELHRKFVAAVNQLGIDKAVPKRILDLMNVDKLTRENVASHLQKYRLYLKRLSAVASQHAGMASALGGRDANYLRMGSFNNFGNYHCLSSSGHLQGFPSFQSSGPSSRTDPNLLGLPGLPLETALACHTQNITNNPMNDLSKFQHITAPSNQNENILPSIPTSLELDQFHQKQKKVQESNYYLPPEVFSATGNYNFIDPMNNSLLPEGSKYNEAWQSAPLLSGDNSGNTLSIQDSFNNDNIVSSCLGGSHTSSFSPLMNFKCSANLNQKQEDLKQQNAIESNIMLSSSSASKVSNLTLNNTFAGSQRLPNRLFKKKVNVSTNSQPIFAGDLKYQQDQINKVIVDCQLTFNEENMLRASKGSLAANNCNFDELMNAVIKPEREDIGFVDGELSSDLFPLSTCM